MYLNDLLTSLVRRWYLLAAAIVVAAALGLGAAAAVGPTYAAEGAVVLIPPVDRENPEANRFLALGNLKQTGDILVRALNSDSTHSEVEDSMAADGEYTVEADLTTSAPVLVVHAEAGSRSAAQRLLDLVLAQAPKNMEALQTEQQIKKKNLIVVEVIDVDEKPAYVFKGQLRAGAAVAVLALGGMVVGVGAVDALLLRRSQRGMRPATYQPETSETDPRGRGRPNPSRVA